MVVDDTPVNLRLLFQLLTEQGYRVRAASGGKQALEVVAAAAPDLILLDVMMPEMDGLAVSQVLKAAPQTRDIPIIFITALGAVNDKIRAFAAGGADYVTKPFHAEEVLARIEVHLTLRQTQQKLYEQIAELNAFARMVAHDIKSPLSVIAGYADVLAGALPDLAPAEIAQSAQQIRSSARKTIRIVDELLLLATIRDQTILPTPLDMATIVAEVQQRLTTMMVEYQGQLTIPTRWPTALGHAGWIEEVWMNYLSNGLKYGGRPPSLELGATPQADGTICFWVRDNGPGLTPEQQSLLFTEFTRLSQFRIQGYGLGLSIVKRIIDKLGGQVGVNSQIGQGSTFYFILPSSPPQI